MPSPSLGFTCVSKTSTCRSRPLIGCLALRELGDEVLGQFGADFGVSLLGLDDELLQARMVVAGVGLEVVPAALHVAVVRVEQAPRARRPRRRL